MFKDVMITWHDLPDEIFSATVCIGTTFSWEADDEIFFYFDNEQEYLDAFTGDGLEFRIVEEY